MMVLSGVAGLPNLMIEPLRRLGNYPAAGTWNTKIVPARARELLTCPVENDRRAGNSGPYEMVDEKLLPVM